MCPVLPIPNSTSHTDIRRFDIDIPRVKEWLLREIHGRKQVSSLFSYRLAVNAHHSRKTPDTSRVEVAPSSTSHGQQHGISRELNNPPHPSQSLTAPGSSSPPILNVSAIPDGGAHVLPQEKEIRKSLSDKRAIARAKVTSDAIDIQIRRDRGMLRSSRKILLLGKHYNTLSLTSPGAISSFHRYLPPFAVLELLILELVYYQAQANPESQPS